MAAQAILEVLKAAKEFLSSDKAPPPEAYRKLRQRVLDKRTPFKFEVALVSTKFTLEFVFQALNALLIASAPLFEALLSLFPRFQFTAVGKLAHR